MDRAPCSLPCLWVKGTANRVSQIKGKRFNGQARRQLWLTCASVCRMCTGEGGIHHRKGIAQRDIPYPSAFKGSAP